MPEVRVTKTISGTINGHPVEFDNATTTEFVAYDVAEPKVEVPEEPQPDTLPPEPTPEPETPDEGAPSVEVPEQTRSAVIDAPIQVRSMAKREIDVRLLPWNVQIDTSQGPEEFARGSWADTPDDGLLLFGLEHEAHMGLGQDGSPRLVRRPNGRSFRVWEGADGPYASFRVARTQSGDELLALADDKVITGVSVEFAQVPGGTSIVNRGGRRVRIHNRVAGHGATLTYRPAYGAGATVIAVRSQEEAPVPEVTEAPGNGAGITHEEMQTLLGAFQSQSQTFQEKMLARLETVESNYRSSVTIPTAGMSEAKELPSLGEWGQAVIKLLTGERLHDWQMRALDDVITTDNAGVVPPAYLTEIRGVIDTSRPFLATTRRLPTPDAGTQIMVPVINQRPTTAVQTTEKTEVDSTKTLIGTSTFNMLTIAGAGDLSIQLIKRSSPSFLQLWIELLGEAYAIDAEDEAVHALLDAIGGVGGASALNPASLNLGSAFVTSFDAIRRPPDTIWLSTQAIGEFIDAKATTTNQPLYPGLTASATAAGGITGTISGLRAVHVPALDAHGAYAIVGPSSGFAWAEDGTYTLQVDVPAKAGRDVALVGMLWLIPWYPAAFTAYNVAS